MAVEYRVTTEPTIIRQAGELMPEGSEQPPYAPNFVPPYPFTPAMTANGSGSGSTSDNTFSQVPGTYNISVVRGDAVSIDFFFEGVCWTWDRPQDDTGTDRPDPVDPSAPVAPELPVAWEQHWWTAQVRNPKAWSVYDPCYWYNNWIPAFGLYPDWLDWFKATLVTEFTCTAVFSDNFGDGTFGTWVNIALKSIEMIHWPSNDYRWDLQSATEMVMDDTVDPPVYAYMEGVRTWLQGQFEILTDYTVNPLKLPLTVL